jgi:hypothetical protein
VLALTLQRQPLSAETLIRFGDKTMALWPNGTAMFMSPVKLLAGQTSAFNHQRDYAEAGNKIHTIANSQMSRKASVPEGYAPYAYTLPVRAGGMSGFPRIVTISATPAMIAGSTVAGDATLTLTGEASASLITTISGAYGLTLSPNTPELKLTLGLVGNYGFIFDGISALAIIDPMTGSWSMTLTPSANLKGRLSIAGEFRNSDDAVTVDYQGAVYVSDFGSDGFTYPAGTATSPVATMACADFLANKYGLRTYYINGTHTLLGNKSHCQFIGWGPLAGCTLILDDTYTLEECKFTSLIITGSQNSLFQPYGFSANLGTEQFESCYIYSVENLAGNFLDCQFAGNIKIKPGKWISAQGAVIEGDTTYFDLQSTPGTTVSMDVASGWFQLQNSVTGCLCELNVKGGEVSLDETCTGGEYYLEGIGTLFNDSAMEKKDNHFVWNEQSTYVREVGSTGALLYGAGGGSSPVDIADAVWSKVLP